MDIKKLREQKGMTQEGLAHELGVSFKTVNRWERGWSKPSPLAVRRLEELFGFVALFEFVESDGTEKGA